MLLFVDSIQLVPFWGGPQVLPATHGFVASRASESRFLSRTAVLMLYANSALCTTFLIPSLSTDWNLGQSN